MRRYRRKSTKKNKRRLRRKRTRRKRGGWCTDGTKLALTTCKRMLNECCPHGDERVAELFDEMDKVIEKLQADEGEIILALMARKDEKFIKGLIKNEKISKNFREALKDIKF